MRSCTEEIGLDVLQSTDEKITQNTLTASPVLTFFDPAKEKLSRDASEPLVNRRSAPPSRKLETSGRWIHDRKCAQIKNKGLRLVFHLEKFHTSIYGFTTLTVETGHCILVSIIKT